MKSREKGFTLTELLISVTIMSLTAGAAGMATFQIMKNNDRNTGIMTAARQIDNAGAWISRDTQMALSVSTTNLTSPVFLSMSWTENVSADDPIYHTANYSIEDIADGIGTLKRYHSSTAGLSEQTLIAQYVYYDLSDGDNTTEANYDSPVLTVKVSVRVGEVLETREYTIRRRPNTYG